MYTFTTNDMQAESASPTLATFPSTPSSGNLLIAVVVRNSQSGSVSVVDGNSNAFTQEASLNFNGSGSQILIFLLIAGASQSKAITASGTGTIFLDIHEFSGNQASLTGIIDTSNTGLQSAVTTSSGNQPSVTTTNANDLIFTAIGFSTSITSPTWTGASMLEENNVGGSLIHLVDGYQIETATGTYNPYLTWTNSRNFGQITLAIKPAAGGSLSFQQAGGFFM